VTINGKSRTYYIVLPSNYDANTPYPVVTGWPYYGSVAEDLLPPASGTGFGEANFYGIRPGIPNAIYTTAQGLPATAGGTDYVWNNNSGEDVALAKAMVTALETNYCVDQSRIFAAGMSYGGVMSVFLGCEAPDIFRALGIIAGGTMRSTANCMKHPIAAWFTHGDADGTVPIATGITARDLFIQDNGCDTTNTQSVVLDSKTTCTVYNNCTAGNYPVVWCPVVGGTHTIPSFSAAEIIKFFKQF
jgi:poly(3-hydroxybutyrate) depolymerase